MGKQIIRRSELVKKEFERLFEQWEAEAGHLPFEQMFNHPAYLSIIGLGPQVISCVLESLHRKPSHIFVALQCLTEIFPPEEMWGKINEMCRWWLEWGERNGYLKEK